MKTELTIMDFYKKSLARRRMIDGEMRSTSGLCDYFEDSKHADLFLLMKPTEKDYAELREKGLSTYVWASGKSLGQPGCYYRFNGLRQNIVLFMAAMNGEL